MTIAVMLPRVRSQRSGTRILQKINRSIDRSIKATKPSIDRDARRRLSACLFASSAAIVVCSASATLEDGCDCSARLDPAHDSTFKRVYFDEAEGSIRLQPLNPDFPPRIVKREQVAGLYRAVGRYSKL